MEELPIMINAIKSRGALLLLLALIVPILAACGGGTTSSPPSAATPGAAAAPTAMAEPTAAPAAAAPTAMAEPTAASAEAPTAAAATGGSASGPQPPTDQVKLNGAGATFPFVLYSKWFSEYNKLYSNIQINYQSIGSGGGIKQFTEKTVDFGASDAPMKDDQIQAAGGAANVYHIPTVLGGVVPTYNLEGSPKLKFTGEVLANIFLGKITKWNDPALTQLNPDAKLPDADIAVVHRSDGSGTSFVWTDYLSKVSPDWKSGPGASTSVNWPVGVGGKGNEGVAGLVKQTPNALGYVELAYAIQNQQAYGSVQNKAGKFVDPAIDSLTAAASGTAGSLPDDLRVSITDCDCPDGYPISSYTYILVNPNQTDATKAQTLVSFLWWGIHDGEKFAKDLNYAPLPPEVVAKAEAKIKQINVGGKPVFGG
jgi:phosphate transport system substrate-binding protein